VAMSSIPAIFQNLAFSQKTLVHPIFALQKHLRKAATDRFCFFAIKSLAKNENNFQKHQIFLDSFLGIWQIATHTTA
jgi:hypothetical protein